MDSIQVLASQEVHDIAVAIGVDPAQIDLTDYVIVKFASWPMLIPMAPILQHYSVLCF